MEKYTLEVDVDQQHEEITADFSALILECKQCEAEHKALEAKYLSTMDAFLSLKTLYEQTKAKCDRLESLLKREQPGTFSREPSASL
ncbi:MAG: hypothetical protein LBD29_03975 [Treponema sp.]|nr:hypothetical protein [Treponema sp.]